MIIQKVWIYGSGGHAMAVFDVITGNNSGYEVAGFIDDDPIKIGSMIFGRHIYGKSRLEAVSGSLDKNIFIAIGNNIVRQKIAENFKGHKFPVLLHKSAVISSKATIGEGSIVMPLSIIEIGTTIGAHCIINNSALVGHGTRIGNYCHISGMVILGGNVTIGDSTLVGLGACIAPGVTIGKRCKIVAGSVITKNVADDSVIAGYPAKNISKVVNSAF
jgi:acetyltransferase EpsM